MNVTRSLACTCRLHRSNSACSTQTGVGPRRSWINLLAMGILVLALSSGPADAAKTPLKKGETAPPARWLSHEGELLSWDELRQGEPLVAVFWATWCTACKKDWPRLEGLARKHSRKPGAPRWVAISLGEKKETVQAAVAARGLSVRSLLDPKEENGKRLGIHYVPTVCVLDRDGRVVYLDAPKLEKLDRVLGGLTVEPESRDSEGVPESSESSGSIEPPTSSESPDAPSGTRDVSGGTPP